MFRKIIVGFVCLFSIFFSGTISAQEIRDNYHFTYFGINFSPIIPSNIIQRHDVTVVKDSFILEVKQKPSFIFGMEVKHDFTRFLALQTGINFAQRKYDVRTTFGDTVHANSLKFIGYEIPVLALGFVRLSKHIFADLSTGFCMNFYPSDIAVQHYYGQRYRWMQFSMLLNLGVEYRNELYGNIYLGLLYQYHDRSAMSIYYFQDQIYGKSDTHADVSGNYFSINLKYYFPQNPEKLKKQSK